jgi:cytochrome oxidase Cu insertion factor (SCO1/SenC/PrrC family)
MKLDRPDSSPRGPILAVAALLATVLGAPFLSAAEVEVGAPFTLIDQNGKTRTDADFRGSYMLIYFGFTYCPDICPTALLTMIQALDKLAMTAPVNADRVVPIFITIDPMRDTSDVLKDYAASFSRRLVALTGKPEDLRDVAYGYGVFFAKGPGGGENYMMDHTGFTYLMGPDGRYITHFEKDVTVEELARVLEAQTAAKEPQR